MSKVACMFVGWEAPFFTIVEGVVHLAFPGAITVALPTLEKATIHGRSSAAELLVLANPSIADLAKAPAMTGVMGLPLFQPFHLLHRPDTKRGLGLSRVRRLVELQGGDCGYEPYSVEGSCFFFTLPAGELENAAEAINALVDGLSQPTVEVEPNL